MRFVCPFCRGAVLRSSDTYDCVVCKRTYPIVGGIPDFRLAPDPYIGLEEDRAKGLMLMAAGRTRSFEQVLRYYYEVTPEDPTDLARHWIARSLAEVEIARDTLQAYGLQRQTGKLLDLGCSTGAMLAAAPYSSESVGVDVAFRWLAVASVRLRDLGVAPQLVCANAEHLPFPDCSFDTVTALDLLEHVREPLRAVKEAKRVSATGAQTLWITNNRYAPLPDPQVRIWGVGLLPRRWQKFYVARRRPDLHVYQVAMLGARELSHLFENAGYSSSSVAAAALFARHLPKRWLTKAVGIYNRLCRIPVFRELLTLVGPKLVARTPAVFATAVSARVAHGCDCAIIFTN